MNNNILNVDKQEITLGELTLKLVRMLEHAQSLTDELTKQRARQKLSIMRISNVSRELKDLIKVVGSIKCC